MIYVYRVEDSKSGFVFDGKDDTTLCAADALRNMREYHRHYKTGKNARVYRYPLYSNATSKFKPVSIVGYGSGFINPDEKQYVPDTIYRIITDDVYDPTQKYDRVFFDNLSDARRARDDINIQHPDNVAYIAQTEVLDINPKEYDSRYEYIVYFPDFDFLIAPNWWATI